MEWTGKIAIPEPGDYAFGLRSIDESTVWIDGTEVTAGVNPNQYAEGALTLDAGLHDIRVRFADRTAHTNVNLFWSPPWGGHEIVPADVLFPPQASYARVELPTASNCDAPPARTEEVIAVAGPICPSSPRWSTR
ncbi:MAG: PA14 domain-containing protein [Caldilineaceae bacterium]